MIDSYRMTENTRAKKEMMKIMRRMETFKAGENVHTMLTNFFQMSNTEMLFSDSFEMLVSDDFMTDL